MKHIYVIGGTMGVGKTTTSQALKKKLNNSVFLDGGAIERIPLFYALRTTKVDVSHITPEQAADFIIEKC